MLFQRIKEYHNQHSITREDEAIFSHTDSQNGSYTQLTIAIIKEELQDSTIIENRTKLVSKDSRR